MEVLPVLQNDDDEEFYDDSEDEDEEEGGGGGEEDWEHSYVWCNPPFKICLTISKMILK